MNDMNTRQIKCDFCGIPIPLDSGLDEEAKAITLFLPKPGHQRDCFDFCSTYCLERFGRARGLLISGPSVHHAT